MGRPQVPPIGFYRTWRYHDPARAGLKSERAVKMNIAIVRAFIALREMVFFYKEMADQMSAIRNRLGEHDVQLNAIYEAIENMLDEQQNRQSWDDRNRIGFNQ